MLSWLQEQQAKILFFFPSAQDTQKLQQLEGQLEMIRVRAPRAPPAPGAGSTLLACLAGNVTEEL